MEDKVPENLESQMPADSITRDFQILFDARDSEIVAKMAKKYNVSETALTLRLIDLGLV